MRIRSIRPEFWSSEDIARLPWDERLIFIGLWSYVDDNGVGRDIEKLIVADLFPLDDDTHGALKKIAGALKRLETGRQISRYSVGGRRYLHITAWDKHQKINRPSEGRYPLPTCDDTRPPDVLTDPSLIPHDSLSAGEGEKGRRGEVLQTPSSASADAAFAAFWFAYPRKVGKQAARKVYDRKRRATTDAVIATGAQRLRDDPNLPEPQYVPHPATWLARGGWEDEPCPVRIENVAPSDRRAARNLALIEQYDQQERKALS